MHHSALMYLNRWARACWEAETAPKERQGSSPYLCVTGRGIDNETSTPVEFVPRPLDLKYRRRRIPTPPVSPRWWYMLTSLASLPVAKPVICTTASPVLFPAGLAVLFFGNAPKGWDLAQARRLLRCNPISPSPAISWRRSLASCLYPIRNLRRTGARGAPPTANG